MTELFTPFAQYAVYTLLALLTLAIIGAASTDIADFLDDTACALYNTRYKSSMTFDNWHIISYGFLASGIAYIASHIDNDRARGAFLAVGIPTTVLINLAVVIGVVLTALGIAAMIAVGIGVFMLIGWIIEQMDSK